MSDWLGLDVVSDWLGLDVVSDWLGIVIHDIAQEKREVLTAEKFQVGVEKVAERSVVEDELGGGVVLADVAQDDGA